MLKKIQAQLREGKTFLQFSFLKALGQGLTMILPLVVAKFFSEELFASYSIATMVAFFFSVVMVNSLQTAFVVFSNQEKVEKNKLNATFTAQCLFFFTTVSIVALALFFFAEQLANFAKIAKQDLWFVFIAFLGLALKTSLCNLFLATNERIKSAFAEFVYGLATLLLIFIFYFTIGINIRTVFSIYMISALLLWLIFVGLINFKLLLPFSLRGSHIVDMLHFSKWPLIGLTAVYFINWGYNFILRFYNVDFAKIGDCNLAFRFFKGVVTLASIVGVYFLPFISQNIYNQEKMKDLWSRKRRHILLLGFSCIAVLAVVAPVAIRLIYKNKYPQTRLIFVILLIAGACHLYNTFFYAVYNALRLNKYIHILDIIHVLISLGLNLLLIPFWGLVGAAAATVTAYIIKSFILRVHYNKKIRPQIGL